MNKMDYDDFDEVDSKEIEEEVSLMAAVMAALRIYKTENNIDLYNFDDEDDHWELLEDLVEKIEKLDLSKYLNFKCEHEIDEEFVDDLIMEMASYDGQLPESRRYVES